MQLRDLLKQDILIRYELKYLECCLNKSLLYEVKSCLSHTTTVEMLEISILKFK